MEDKQKDFMKLKEVLNRIPKGEYTPKQLGTLFQQYYEKYLAKPAVEKTAEKDPELTGNLFD